MCFALEKLTELILADEAPCELRKTVNREEVIIKGDRILSYCNDAEKTKGNVSDWMCAESVLSNN